MYMIHMSAWFFLTFSKGGDLQRQADDPHQVLDGDQRPQDGPDPQRLSLPRLDQLQEHRHTAPEGSALPRGRASVAGRGFALGVKRFWVRSPMT